MFWSKRHPLRQRPGTRPGWWLCVLLSLFSAGAAAAAMPLMVNPEPGGIARVILGQSELVSLTARFGQHRVIVNREAGQWVALVGLPISIEPGNYILSLEAEEQESLEPVVFSVKPAKTTVLQVPREPPSEQPLTVSRDNIRATAEIVQRAIGTWNDTPLPDFRFGAPVRGAELYPYSLLITRVTGQIRQHDYISFLAPAGSLVLAPQAGQVQTVANLPEHGATVFIDHGHSLISMIGGLGEITVEPGDTVQQGAAIGTVNQTDGRAMSEVDWALYLNGQKIDSAPLLGTVNQPEFDDN